MNTVNVKDRSAVNYVVWRAVTAIADDDSEFPVCLTGLISICVHVCVGLVCSVEPAV